MCAPELCCCVPPCSSTPSGVQHRSGLLGRIPPASPVYKNDCYLVCCLFNFCLHSRGSRTRVSPFSQSGRSVHLHSSPELNLFLNGKTLIRHWKVCSRKKRKEKKNLTVVHLLHEQHGKRAYRVTRTGYDRADSVIELASSLIESESCLVRQSSLPGDTCHHAGVLVPHGDIPPARCTPRCQVVAAKPRLIVEM